MRYSVGIPVRNEQHTLADCVQSALQQSQAPEQVYICVNASTDDTLSTAHHIADKQEKVCVLESEPGKPNAWNTIAKQDTPNKMLMVDGDVLVNRYSAEAMLHQFSEEEQLSIVGGNFVFQTPVEQTFIAKTYARAYDKVVTLNHLLGGLYMYDKKNLFTIGDAVGVDIMPRNIINEDGFLELIARQKKAFKVNARAFCVRHPVNSFYDMIITSSRIGNGIMQLENDYPDLVKQVEKDDDYSSKNAMLQRAKNFWNTPGFQRKIGKLAAFTIHKGIRFYVGAHNALCKETVDNVWKVPETTKVSFSKAAYEYSLQV